MTLIGPVVAPVGTTAAIEESEPTLKLAAVPLNFTELAPVNPDPAMLTEVPLGPLAGEKELILGAAVAVVTLNEDVLVPVPQLF